MSDLNHRRALANAATICAAMLAPMPEPVTEHDKLRCAAWAGILKQYGQHKPKHLNQFQRGVT